MPDLSISPEAIETDIVAPEHIEEYRNGMAFLYNLLMPVEVERLFGNTLKNAVE